MCHVPIAEKLSRTVTFHNGSSTTRASSTIWSRYWPNIGDFVVVAHPNYPERLHVKKQPWHGFLPLPDEGFIGGHALLAGFLHRLLRALSFKEDNNAVGMGRWG
jgi:hypothetical protein